MTLHLNDASLLDASERASTFARPWQELVVLAAASDKPIEELARLPIGHRDRLLLELRADMFGDRLDCEASCPSCGARLELSLSVAELCRVPPRALAARAELVVNGERVTLRLPDSLDLAASAVAPARAAAIVLDRCVERMPREGGAPLRPEAIDFVAAQMAALDPLADLQLDLQCPACGHAWTSSFDPAGFLLHEIDVYAARLLDDVHLLARAYGWREGDILAMGPLRRRRYLERVLQ